MKYKIILRMKRPSLIQSLLNIHVFENFLANCASIHYKQVGEKTALQKP